MTLPSTRSAKLGAMINSQSVYQHNMKHYRVCRCVAAMGNRIARSEELCEMVETREVKHNLIS